MKPPTPSVLPEVLEALVALCRQIDVEDLIVVDGPADHGNIGVGKSVIEIGVRDGDGETVRATYEEQPGLRKAYTETLWVVCGISSTSGSRDLAPRRRKCRDLLAAVDALLRQNPHLSVEDGEPVADGVGLGPDMSWVQDLDEQGAVVSLGFSIRVRALI